MPGRRATLRRDLLASVRDAAHAQLREVGPANLSLRAIAREVGISPAGLYRYYDGRDALLTMLIADAYDDLADHLFLAQGLPDQVIDPERARDVEDAVAADAPGRDRVAATWRTYRRWARARRNAFHLLFGEPVAGYDAPADGETVQANARVYRALMTAPVLAWQAGELALPDDGSRPAGTTRLAEEISAAAPVEVPPGFARLALWWWATLHGHVALEVNGQFRWLGEDHAVELFESTLALALDDRFLPIGSR